jgi:SAM-dependent methyltransferase
MPIERAIPGGPLWDALAAHHLTRYLFALDLAAGKRVLDAGTGAGYGAALLASRAARVLAVDIDAASIATAQKVFDLANLTYLVDDCHTLAATATACAEAPGWRRPAAGASGGANGGFDLIVNFENIEHLPHPEQFLAAAAKLLRPTGTLLISTPDRANTPPFKDGKPDNPFHMFEWYRDEFRALLAPHFATIDMKVQVQSYALRSREEAVDALKGALMWANPLGTFLWRKLTRTKSRTRSWRALDSLAAPALTDYPIVDAAMAAIWGTSYCHFAVCTNPTPT